MKKFPRVEVGGISLPRIIIGTNWFLGYSHTSAAKSRFIREYQNRDNRLDCSYHPAGKEASDDHQAIGGGTAFASHWTCLCLVYYSGTGHGGHRYSHPV